MSPVFLAQTKFFRINNETTLFVLDPSLWGHKGVPPCWRHPQIQWITGTGMPNLDPFLLLLLTITFQQTTIKHSLYMQKVH